MTPYVSCNNWRFGRTFRLHHQCERNQRAVNNVRRNPGDGSDTFPKTSVLTRLTWRHIPETAFLILKSFLNHYLYFSKIFIQIPKLLWSTKFRDPSKRTKEIKVDEIQNYYHYYYYLTVNRFVPCGACPTMGTNVTNSNGDNSQSERSADTVDININSSPEERMEFSSQLRPSSTSTI
jgi:hypothetical protein